ncbi:uncharacterized protein WM294_001196 [Sarcoramphus papa]
MDAMTLLSQLGASQTETLYLPKAIKCVNVYEVACTLTQDGSEVDGPQLASGWKLNTLETSHLRLKGHCKFMYSDNNQLYHWAYVFPPLAGCAALPAPAAASGGRRASGAGCPRLPASRERRPGSAGTPRLSPAPLVRPAGRRPVLAHAQTARGCRGAGSHLRRPAGTSQAWPSSRRRRLPSAENVDKWSFDVFALNDASGDHALKFTFYELLTRYDLINRFKIPISALVSFVEALEVGYSKHKNPYHNLMHAADLMGRGKLAKLSSHSREQGSASKGQLIPLS